VAVELKRLRGTGGGLVCAVCSDLLSRSTRRTVSEIIWDNGASEALNIEIMPQDNEFSIIVTGGASGIGEAIARSLQAEESTSSLQISRKSKSRQ
jgi:hypothetical protein